MIHCFLGHSASVVNGLRQLFMKACNFSWYHYVSVCYDQNNTYPTCMFFFITCTSCIINAIFYISSLDLRATPLVMERWKWHQATERGPSEFHLCSRDIWTVICSVAEQLPLPMSQSDNECRLSAKRTAVLIPCMKEVTKHWDFRDQFLVIH